MGAAPTTAVPFTAASPLKFTTCGEDDFHLYLVAPATGKYTLLGEPDKWISVSSQRFSDLAGSDDHASVKVHGQAGEKVTIRWADADGKISSTMCELSAAGQATSQISTKSGASCASS